MILQVPLPETKSKFAPENGWLEDYVVSLLGRLALFLRFHACFLGVYNFGNVRDIREFMFTCVLF